MPRGWAWLVGEGGWFWHQSIRRLLASFILLSGLLVLLPMLVHLALDYRHDRHQALEQMNRLTGTLAHYHATQLESADRLLLALARYPELDRWQGPDCPTMFKTLAADNPLLANAGLVDGEGRLLCSSILVEGRPDLSELPFFQAAQEPGQVVMGEAVTAFALPDAVTVVHLGYRLPESPIPNDNERDEAAPGPVLFIALDPAGGAQMESVHHQDYALSLIAGDGGGAFYSSQGAEMASAQKGAVAEMLARDGDESTHPVRIEDSGQKGLHHSVYPAYLGDEARVFVVVSSRLALELGPVYLRLITALGFVGLAILILFFLAHRLSRTFQRLNVDPVLSGLDRMARGEPAALSGAGSTREIRRIADTIHAVDQAHRADAARMRLHLEESPLAVVEWDLDFRVIDWSHGAEALFGWSADEVLGLTPSDWGFVYDDDWGSVQAHFSELLGGQKDRFQFENRNWARDGRIVACAWFTSILRDDAGAMHSFLTFAMDISDRVAAEEDLKRLNQELEWRVAVRTRALEMSMRELEAFSYSVSHDLRAPLRGIDGFAQALEEDYGQNLDSQARHYIQRIRHGAGRMGALIDDLLELSRVTRSELTRETLSMTDLAIHLCRELEEADPDHAVDWQIAPDLTVEADPVLSRQLLANLLANAWKFTRFVQQPQVILEGETDKQSGRRVFILRDNGAGFEADQAEEVFAPFRRLHAQKDFEGTGIGLATVYRIVQRHGGWISASGEPGKGACFQFSLEPEGGHNE